MNEKLKIFILGDYLQGGADGLTEFNYQNVSLLKDKFNFTFVKLDLDLPQKLYFRETRDDIDIHCFGARNLLPFQLPRAFYAFINSLDVDNSVFHLSHIHNFNNYLVARLLVKRRIPYLITPHDSYVYCQSVIQQKTFAKKWYKIIFVHFFDRYVLNNANVVHDLTNKYTTCLKELTKSKIMIVGNQINDMNLTFDESSVKQQICFIGRFDILNKGIDLALESYKLLKKAREFQDTQFILIGPSEGDADVTRKKICDDLGLKIGKDVFFTGRVTEEKRNQILKESKVYFQLSRFEGFGLSIVQALSSYKPVIVSKQIPISSKILEHNAGFVVSNPQEAADALSLILDMPSTEYSKMAMNARHCYEEEYHPAVVKPHLINLYEETYSRKHVPAYYNGFVSIWSKVLNKSLNALVRLKYPKVSKEYREFYKCTYYCQIVQLKYILKDYLTRKKYKVISYSGEFANELQFVIPFAYWHYKNGTLKETESSNYTREFYFFAENHKESFDVRTNDGNFNYEIPRILYSQNYDISKWAAVPFKEMYRNNIYNYDKPILIIANRYNMEWDGMPISYFSIPMLSSMINKLKDEYTIIYNRPNSKNIINDESVNYELNEVEWLKQEYPEVLNMEELFAENKGNVRNFNHLQLMVYANADHFISTHGGTATLASYFGGINLILSKKGPEHHFRCYEMLYPKLSEAKILHAKSDEDIIRLLDLHFLDEEPATFDQL